MGHMSYLRERERQMGKGKHHHFSQNMLTQYLVGMGEFGPHSERSPPFCVKYTPAVAGRSECHKSKCRAGPRRSCCCLIRAGAIGMERSAYLILLAFTVFMVGSYALFAFLYNGDKEAILESFRELSQRLGRWMMPVFVLVHALTISLCLPYAVIFEAGAAYLFGLFAGILCVFSAKILSATLSFWTGRALFHSSVTANKWIQKNKYFHVISEGVAQDGWRFVLLARFSPVPSYVINYGLAATNVRFFVDFLLPTVVGCLPMILQNTSVGSLTSIATHTGGESQKTGILTYIFPLIGLASGVLISWRIKKYVSNISNSFQPSASVPEKRHTSSQIADEVLSSSRITSEKNLFDANLRHRACAAS